MTDPDNRLEQQLRQALDQSTATLDQATCDELARRRADVLNTTQRSYRPQPWLIAAALATFAVQLKTLLAKLRWDWTMLASFLSSIPLQCCLTDPDLFYSSSVIHFCRH